VTGSKSETLAPGSPLIIDGRRSLVCDIVQKVSDENGSREVIYFLVTISSRRACIGNIAKLEGRDVGKVVDLFEHIQPLQPSMEALTLVQLKPDARDLLLSNSIDPAVSESDLPGRKIFDLIELVDGSLIRPGEVCCEGSRLEISGWPNTERLLLHDLFEVRIEDESAQIAPGTPAISANKTAGFCVAHFPKDRIVACLPADTFDHLLSAFDTYTGPEKHDANESFSATDEEYYDIINAAEAARIAAQAESEAA
jgi:hypothetical protein